MYVSGLAGWCTGQLPQGRNSEAGRMSVFWSDLVLWGAGTKHVRGKAGQLFRKHGKTRCSASTCTHWWELFPGLEARGEALGMEQALSQQKVVWKKRLKPVRSSQAAAIGRIGPGLTWSAGRHQLIIPGLLSSPVASWGHQAGFVWLVGFCSN